MGKIVGRFREARLTYQGRTGRELTLKQVADMLGISRQAYSDIENGKRLPRYETLAALCKLYGVQPGDVLVYEDRLARLLAMRQQNTNSRAESEAAGMVGAVPALHP
jgi:transcriptional regulator with XRE-family HTH domain